jgi:hypothetical protein
MVVKMRGVTLHNTALLSSIQESLWLGEPGMTQIHPGRPAVSPGAGKGGVTGSSIQYNTYMLYMALCSARSTKTCVITVTLSQLKE